MHYNVQKALIEPLGKMPQIVSEEKLTSEGNSEVVRGKKGQRN